MGRVVGDGGKFFYVQDLVVVPHRQGEGIGRMVLDRLITQVKNIARSRRPGSAHQGGGGFGEPVGLGGRQASLSTPGWGAAPAPRAHPRLRRRRAGGGGGERRGVVPGRRRSVRRCHVPRGSAFAECVCVPETAPIVHKPPTVSFAEASTLPQAAVIALQGTSGALSRGIGSWSMVLAGERAPSRCRWRRPPGRRSLVSTTAGNRS